MSRCALRRSPNRRSNERLGAGPADDHRRADARRDVLASTSPIVQLRDVVVFPHMMMPCVIGRASSIRALEHALAKDKRVFLAAQHDASVDDPKPDAIWTMGCVANVAQSLKLPDGNIKVLVEGIDRARVIEWKKDEDFYRVVVKVLPNHTDPSGDGEGTMSRVVALF